tara:strand:+ start:95 stop:301 length:207 start_codon:yes stop_codon:yes gene_type:complete
MPGMTEEEKQKYADIEKALAENNAKLPAFQKTILLKYGKPTTSTSVEMPPMDQDPKVTPRRRTIDMDK